MAPLPQSSILNLNTSSPPVKRSSSSSSTSTSPLSLYHQLLGRDTASGPEYQPGRGTVDPTSINNNGMLGLFGLLGAAFVLASIWFFFWAKNGGFRWRKGDWDDYKSTVLRRKGPDGKTLSNATRSTKLGGGSIVGSLGSMSDFVSEKGDEGPGGIRGGGAPVRNNKTGNKKGAGNKVRKPTAFHAAAAGVTGVTGTPKHNKDKKQREKKTKNKQDDDVRAYRHEKVAKVGGLNREAEGSYHDWTNTAPSVSDTGSSAPLQKPSRQPEMSNIKKNSGARQFSYTAGTESRFSAASDDSHRPLRTHAQTPGRNSRGPSPTKHMNNNHRNSHQQHHASSGRGGGTSMPGSYTEPLDFESRYDGSSQGGSEANRTNTKSYFHPIPGLSKGPNSAAAGFRRGAGPGRRDSLSDSE